MNGPIKNRYEFMLFLACRDSNPNGDPDMANMPRTDPDTMHGYMTDVSVKRRVRDYVAMIYGDEPGMEILVTAGTDLNVAIARVKDGVAQELGVKLNEKSPAAVTKASLKMCEKFFDVRTFGAVMSTGSNAGQVRGPVQLSFGRSLDPVQPQDISVTRVASAEIKADDLRGYENAQAASDNDKLRTIGRKQFIPFGLYEIHGFVSANLAAQTGFSEYDLECLLKALANAYDTLHSATKGEIGVVGPVIVFKHVGDQGRPEEEAANQARLGRAPAHKLFELVRCVKKDGVGSPRSHDDYDCRIDMTNLPVGVEIGFLEPFADEIIWGKMPDGECWMQA